MDCMLRLSRRPWAVRTAPLQPPFHLSEFSHTSLKVAAKQTGWEVKKIWAVKGNTFYPVPRLLSLFVAAIAYLGSLAGFGLNLMMLAYKPDPNGMRKLK